MTSDFSAGLSRSGIEYILQLDSEVLSVERVEGPSAMWLISVSFEGGQPVEMLIDNGINELYVQALIQIDADHIAEALRAVEPIAVVGLALMDDRLYMRGAFYIDYSNMHALTNSYRAVAFAYLRYQQAISA